MENAATIPSPGQALRYLTVRILYPRPECLEDVLAAVKNVAAEARQHPGLVEIGAWWDSPGQRLVSISLWESAEQALAATREMHSLFADIPWASWERQAAENFLGLQRMA